GLTKALLIDGADRLIVFPIGDGALGRRGQAGELLAVQAEFLAKGPNLNRSRLADKGGMRGLGRGRATGFVCGPHRHLLYSLSASFGRNSSIIPCITS